MHIHREERHHHHTREKSPRESAQSTRESSVTITHTREESTHERGPMMTSARARNHNHTMSRESTHSSPTSLDDAGATTGPLGPATGEVGARLWACGFCGFVFFFGGGAWLVL